MPKNLLSTLLLGVLTVTCLTEGMPGHHGSWGGGGGVRPYYPGYYSGKNYHPRPSYPSYYRPPSYRPPTRYPGSGHIHGGSEVNPGNSGHVHGGDEVNPGHLGGHEGVSGVDFGGVDRPGSEVDRPGSDLGGVDGSGGKVDEPFNIPEEFIRSNNPPAKKN